jgi:antitoxin VapB
MPGLAALGMALGRCERSLYTMVDAVYQSAYNNGMALNIKNREVERLAAEIAKLTGENKTEAIRRALEERRQRLAFRVIRKDRRTDLLRLLERAVWPKVPRRLLGRRMSRKEEDAILGYGSRGV